MLLHYLLKHLAHFNQVGTIYIADIYRHYISDIFSQKYWIFSIFSTFSAFMPQINIYMYKASIFFFCTVLIIFHLILQTQRAVKRLLLCCYPPDNHHSSYDVYWRRRRQGQASVIADIVMCHQMMQKGHNIHSLTGCESQSVRPAGCLTSWH